MPVHKVQSNGSSEKEFCEKELQPLSVKRLTSSVFYCLSPPSRLSVLVRLGSGVVRLCETALSDARRMESGRG